MMAEEPDERIAHRTLDTDGDDPGLQVARAVADLEDREVTDLAAMYRCVDGVLDHLFSTPPAPEAQMQVAFSYETYRITIEQNGTATFVKTD